MSVSPGMALFEVADLSTVWVMAEIYESDLWRVRVGQPARFEVTAYPGEAFAGKVKFTYPVVDPSSRTLRVRFELRNAQGPGGLKLRPGMYGHVALDLLRTSGLMVPAEAVVDTGELQYLFVVKEGGRFEPRRVRLGERGDDAYEVIEGVAEGEVVVTTANFLIDSESRLRAAIEGQTAKRDKGGNGGKGGKAADEGGKAEAPAAPHRH
jgi:Cu(I)/Ag(I) efflux system membrane fusion protein